MKKTLSMLGTVLILLLILDLGVTGLLHWARESGRLGSLVNYFEYGRSVPGKLEQWAANRSQPGNLYEAAWRSDILALSAKYATEQSAAADIVVRGYGMSFVNNILRKAQEIDPRLTLDLHSGPGAPPNFTYALFLDDAQYRQHGDVAVLGVLSSAVPAMAALSNRTWVFEQPAPFTYPVFDLAGDGLARAEPVVNSVHAELTIDAQPKLQAAWSQQLVEEDGFYTPLTFGAPWLDISPFARLVRRTLAINHIEQTKREILAGAYPYEEVLRRMIVGFSDTARADGQIPVVMLVQSRDPADADLLAIAKPVLERDNIPYLATAELFDPRDGSGFLNDGHYRPEVDRQFGRAFLQLLERLGVRE